METLNVQKVGRSKYGFYLKTEDKFVGCTSQVADYLGKDFKGQAEILEVKDDNGHKIVSKVKADVTKSPVSEARESKQIEMLTSYAKDLFSIAYKNALEKDAEFDATACAKQCAEVILSIRDRITSPEPLQENPIDKDGQYE